MNANKYRKKPVVIEAFQLSIRRITEKNFPEWFQEALKNGKVWSLVNQFGYEIETLEGNHKALLGDFIIQGVKGELYPCKPDIFALTYESLEEIEREKRLQKNIRQGVWE